MNQLSDYIKEYVAFTKDECDLIIEFYEENVERSFSSEVYTAHHHNNLESVSDSRKSRQLSVPLDASIDALIENKINN